MKMKKLFLATFAMGLSAVNVSASAQVNEQAAREKALSAARPHLSYLRPGQFLGIQRDEELEQKLAAMVGGLAGSEFIYKVSPVGDEIKERSVVHHIITDIDDPVSLVAVNPLDGSTYLIHGFAESKSDFNRLMGALKVKISSPDQAEALADFYREVNPERRLLTPATGLLDLKQAAERQCQDVPFDPTEKGFEAWWKHAKPLYSGASFKQTAVRSDSGYAVEWIVLSSPGAGLCGGAPLRARLEVGSDGRVGEIAFVPLRSAGTSTTSPPNPTTDDNGTTHFTINNTALNGLHDLPGAPQDTVKTSINMDITQGGKVGIEGGMRTAYPSLEIYSYDSSGKATTILQMQEHNPSDLRQQNQPIPQVAPQ